MLWLERLALVASAVIHTLPVTGLLGAPALARLYGISVAGDELVLLRHRAVLFAVVAALSVLGLLRESDRTVALIVAGVSAGSFLALCGPGRLPRVFWADVIVFALVAAALAARLVAIGVSTSQEG